MTDHSAKSPRKRRRSLAYGLRTFLIAVTALCIWVGQQSQIVRERRQVRNLVVKHRGVLGPELPGQEPRPSWFRRLLGDEPVGTIWFPASSRLTIEDEERIKAALPEAMRFGSCGR